MIRKIRQIAKHLLEADDEIKIFKKLIGSLDKELNILDVGCGYGEKLVLMRDLGFNRLVGIDVNKDSVDELRKKNFNVYTPEEFDKKNNSKFQLILFSHVVEHFEYRELIAFLENYLSLAEKNSYVIIITPLLTNFFYDNLDHIKPYTPNAFYHLFTDEKHEVQYSSNFRLKLIDIYFRKMPLHFFKYNRTSYLGKINIPYVIINICFAILYFISFKLISRTSGWLGLYKIR